MTTKGMTMTTKGMTMTTEGMHGMQQFHRNAH
jgi:hypothetical protein